MAASTIIIQAFNVPDTNGAGSVTVSDNSTDKAKYPAWSFNATSDSFVDLWGYCAEDFAGGDLEVEIPWLAASDTVTTHKVRWDTYIDKIVPNSSHTNIATEAVASTHTKDSVSSTLSASGSKVTTATITIAAADHALAAGDLFHLRIARDPDHADDDLTGDAYLMEGWLQVREA